MLQLLSVITSGTVLRATYDVNLDAASAPAAGAIVLANTVAVVGGTSTVSGVNCDWPLSTPIGEDETTATASYTAGAAPIRESTGVTNAANFSNQAITHTSPAVLTLKVSRITGTSDTWTPARTGTSTHECRGSGAGGTLNDRGGGGGAEARKAFSHTGGVGYARVGPAGGAANNNGVNSTFNSTTCVAEGGGLSGVRSDGGRASASTGDVAYDGGAGGTGGGAQPGGASAGSGGSGSGITAGALTGAPGASANRTHVPGAGGRCTAGAANAGGAGRVRSFWKEASNGSLPEQRSLGEYRSAGDDTNHSITLPPDAKAGDRVQAFLGWDGSATVTSFTGWTLVSTVTVSTTTVSGGTYERVLAADASAATDPVEIILSAAESLSCLTVAERNAAAAEGATPSTGSSTSADPPSHTPSGGSIARRWYAFIVVDGGGPIQGAPANYDGYGVMPARLDGSTAVSLALLWRELTAASEDPGGFTIVSAAWVGFTVSTERV